MDSHLDYFNQYEIPTFVLCNPDKTELYSLGAIYDRKLELRYNTLSTLSFTAPAQISGSPSGSSIDYYDYLTYRRLIAVYEAGTITNYFMITGVDETNDGVNREKKITAQSLESELALKKLNLFEYTAIQFYPSLTDVGVSVSSTLMGKILAYLPGWSMGKVDQYISSLYRGFNVSDTTIYNFLMNEVEQAYQCLFDFDTVNQEINVYSFNSVYSYSSVGVSGSNSGSALNSSDIYLSYDNLIENIDISEITDELVTGLNVYGKNDLSINLVNPLGTATIYNFDYYKTRGTNGCPLWMSEGLVDALDNWSIRCTNIQAAWSASQTNLSNLYGSEVTVTSEIAGSAAEYAAQETIVQGCIQNGTTGLAIYGAAVAEMNRLQILIDAAEIQLGQPTDTRSSTGSIYAQINQALYQNQITSYNLSFNNTAYFTVDQQEELSHFIVGNTYNNPNFVKLEGASASATQLEAQLLYNQALEVLEKVSKPRYEFGINTANFIFLSDFAAYTSQLELGVVVNLELQSGVVVYPVLLGIDLNYDDAREFNLIFSNRLRLDNGTFQFSDLYNEINQANLSTNFNSEQWSNWTNSYHDTVHDFITSSLDASLNNLVSNSYNQDITINQNGIKGKKITSASGVLPVTYDSRQMWLTSNMLAFTEDNWNHAALALGQISFNNGATTGTAYGLVADVVVGTLLAGNKLTISTTSPIGKNVSFVVDGNGVRLTNAKFELVSTGNYSITLDPEASYKFAIADGGGNNKFTVDGSGNVVLDGRITATSGKIGKWTIDSEGLTDGVNYIRTNGYAKIGILRIDGSSGRFEGNVYANNLHWDVMGGTRVFSGFNPYSGYNNCLSGNNIAGGSGQLSYLFVDKWISQYGSDGSDDYNISGRRFVATATDKTSQFFGGIDCYKNIWSMGTIESNTGFSVLGNIGQATGTVNWSGTDLIPHAIQIRGGIVTILY
jgi:hypothetical protein